MASPNGEFVLTVDLGAEGLFTTAINYNEIEYARSRRGYVDDLRHDALMRNILVNITNA